MVKCLLLALPLCMATVIHPGATPGIEETNLGQLLEEVRDARGTQLHRAIRDIGRIAADLPPDGIDHARAESALLRLLLAKNGSSAKFALLKALGPFRSRAVIDALVCFETKCRTRDTGHGLGITVQRDRELLLSRVREMLQRRTHAPADRTDWESWWEDSRDGFNRPDTRYATPKDSRNGYVFGIPINARRLAILLDVSGSTRPLAEQWHRELATFLDGLDPSTRLNVAVFGTTPQFLWKYPVVAKSGARARARAFLQRGSAGAEDVPLAILAAIGHHPRI